ncbi:MAG: helix-turn-helix domain-containing protein [Candidatus Bathyarchaeota archaeon]
MLFVGLLTVILLQAMAVSAQDEVTPLSLDITVYSDGNVKIVYYVESDPTKVRVDVDLFGSSYSTLVVRDEEGRPLASTPSPSGVTVDSLGATELTFTYYTASLTTKEGLLWTLNVTTPVSSTITLPVGTAIFDLSHVPVDLGTVGGLQYVKMPAGDLSLYYIIGLPNVQQEAQAAIQDAQTYIEDKEATGYVLEGARGQLEATKSLYQQQIYVDAKAAAVDAKQLAISTVAAADSASTKISLSADAVQRARSEGRTSGLSEAEAELQSARQLYQAGSYPEAEMTAIGAAQLATTAKAPDNTMLYAGVVILAAAAAGGYVYLKRVRPTLGQAIPPAPTAPATPAEVDLARIFDKHGDLRLEDKEVLRYLAENNGEAFASEIRDRFDLPRSTAWRLMRRLIREGIVEETKIGNQSLIRVMKKYHKA